MRPGYYNKDMCLHKSYDHGRGIGKMAYRPFSRLLPRVYQIIQEIDRRFLIQVRERYPGNEEKVRKMAILYNGQVRMAHLAIVAGFSVNGVARLHTEILKNQELRDFYEMMPEKFNNKTNGITQRRFLMHGNPLLADWVTEKIGTKGWITDLSLMSGLKKYADDSKALAEFMDIKYKIKYVWQNISGSITESKWIHALFLMYR